MNCGKIERDHLDFVPEASKRRLFCRCVSMKTSLRFALFQLCLVFVVAFVKMQALSQALYKACPQSEDNRENCPVTGGTLWRDWRKGRTKKVGRTERIRRCEGELSCGSHQTGVCACECWFLGFPGPRFLSRSFFAPRYGLWTFLSASKHQRGRGRFTV